MAKKPAPKKLPPWLMPKEGKAEDKKDAKAKPKPKK